MSTQFRWLIYAMFVLVPLGMAACAPEVGSDAWCERMEQTPKGDWTANQAADYARHCVFQSD
jgi:hypothetical protein